MENYRKLAEGLQYSNISEVSELAKAYIALTASYEELRHSYIKTCAEVVMVRHEATFKKLAEWEKNNETE